MKQPNYKIALIGDILSKGGAEKVQARLSFFFESKGIEIHHVIFNDDITYQYAGVLFNLGRLKSSSNGVLNKVVRIIALKKYLRKHRFDFIIDFRTKRNYRREEILTNYLYKSPYILSVHSFNINYYFPKNKAHAEKIFRKAYGIVGVSKAIAEKIKDEFSFKNVTTIYNPIDLPEIERLSEEALNIDAPYFLGIGRMKDNIKQFDQMIEAYGKSEAKKKGIKLVIIGDGPDKNSLQSLVKESNLEQYVNLVPFTNNPYPYYKCALATLLTSKFEGFPNTLIESLAVGTPVVSYNCKSGPDEIITHEYNGLLVQDQDIGAMTEAINKMSLQDEMYNNCKTNAKSSVELLSLDHIGEQWLKFMNLQDLQR